MNPLPGILSSLIQFLGTVLFTYYGWVVIVFILGVLIWQNRRREKWVNQTEHILLLVEVPRENEKKELSAEQMFASLHGILRPKSELLREGALQEHISFEIASIGNQIHFYVWTPKHLKDFVEGQIYAQYPTVRIREGIEDYAKQAFDNRTAYTTELSLEKNDVLPIKTFQSFEVDPLAGITAVLSKLDEAGEEMWLQILARPIDDTWQDKGMHFIDEIKEGKHVSFQRQVVNQVIALPLHVIANFMSGLFAPPESKDDKGKEVKLSTGQQTLVKAVEEKITKLGYQVKIRVTYVGNDPEMARRRMQAFIGGFKQFNTVNLNGFVAGKPQEGSDGIDEYRARLFTDSGSILNIEELASLYHLPHKSVETPNMVWTSMKTSEPPANLPTEATTDQGELSLFATTNFRGTEHKFGIKRRDRGRHLYIIGQTGTGKSKLLNLLTLSDIYHNEGMAIVDPHGDFATDMLQYIPEHRLKDVIYFNPTDRDFPIAFNPLEVFDAAFKNDISSEMVGVLKRMFDSWGPRLEYILRYTILALLDYPDSTMLGITRMLTEKEFRKKVIREIQDPVVKAFWVNEFASWNDKFANEAVAPILNKVGAFVANPLIRNIVGQPKSGFDLRKAMDEGKILVVNLSRGQIGEDNAGVLGALIVTKIQLAAMSRANVPLEQRRPFYLYVDEFQNFATDSFATILSEARKYALNLTVANQYTSQMQPEVRDAVFGNVGSMITFRVGAEDSSALGKYFAPTFEPEDLIKLNNQHILVSMSIDGEKAIPFSAKTLRMPGPERDISAQIIEWSREQFAADRTLIEDDIAVWALGESAKAPVGDAQESSSSSSTTEQKANEFLGALKNPNTHQSSPRSHESGSSRKHKQNGNSSGSHYGRGSHQGQENQRQHHNPPREHQERPGDRRPADRRIPTGVGGSSGASGGNTANGSRGGRHKGIPAGETVSLRQTPKE
mgnify:CR=1 FL=1